MGIISKNVKKLFSRKPIKLNIWKKMFERSSAVHFFSKRTGKWKVIDDPHYNAYALFGSQYCPVAYYSTEHF